jgi:sugar phosphate isomerase/epimerase
MNRRKFIVQSSKLALTVAVAPYLPTFDNKMDRIAMGTVLFRYRFKQTKPKEIETLRNELLLTDVPAYYRDRFGIRQLEFWSNHFESQDRGYLETLRKKIAAAKCKLVNVQIDSAYNLAAENEEERQKSLQHVKEWMDSVAFLGSTCVRINPGSARGPVEKSIQSMKEVNAFAKSKKLVLLTENHFGLEMNPDVHIRITQEAGPGNIYTLPDFGNYNNEVRFASLEKIMPYAYFISAKAMNFNDRLEHISYDFDRCVKLAEQHGFKGIYSVEQWSPQYQDINYEKIGDWLIDHVKSNL